MATKVLPIILYFERQDDRFHCVNSLYLAGFHKGTDYGVFQYKETVEGEVENARGIGQILVIGKISGSLPATELFVRELKRKNTNLRVVLFEPEGRVRNPFDYFVVKGPHDSTFCRELIPIFTRFVGRRVPHVSKTMTA